MNPNIWTPSQFFAYHIASCATRQVVAARNNLDGSRVYQFAQVIKHNGETFYAADAAECL